MMDSIKVLFYSHDTFGLGHIRRTLAISAAVSNSLEDASVLVLTGSSAVHTLRIPSGVDYVKLPSVTKVADEQYESKFLNLNFETLRALREEIIFRIATSYVPDVVFVDNVPLGMKGEMVKTLHCLRRSYPETEIILTLRDVLDEPKRVIANWEANSIYEAIETLYDRVLIYGSPEVFDLVSEYRLPEKVAAKVEYVGYVQRVSQNGAAESIRRQLAPDNEKVVLVTVGGGGDGFEIINNYLTGLLIAKPEMAMHSLVVFGPDMPESLRANLKASFGQMRRSGDQPRVTLADSYGDLTDFIEAADVVLSMGGYNTICEVLSLAKRAVIVPRVEPRLEQWIRCCRLSELGLIRVVHPHEVTPRRLFDEVMASFDERPVCPSEALSFTGLERVSEIVRSYRAAR
jgi:predicted glycosyltransferase